MIWVSQIPNRYLCGQCVAMLLLTEPLSSLLYILSMEEFLLQSWPSWFSSLYPRLTAVSSLDAWFENGSLLRTYPKNPFRRIDTALIQTSIVVKVGSVVIAEANNAVVLYETGLSPRHYLPATSLLDWRWVKEGSKFSTCPYKGEAR